MKYFLIADNENHIVVLEGMNDVKIVKTSLEKLKKHFNLIQYLIVDKETAEYRKEVYSEIAKEKFKVIEVDVELETNVISLDEFRDKTLKDDEFKERYVKDKFKLEIVQTFMTYRKENNLTQKELAKKIGTNQQAISRLENLLINPSLDFLIKSFDKIGYELKVVKKKSDKN